MSQPLSIAIIHTNTLVTSGLSWIFNTYFKPVQVKVYLSADEYTRCSGGQGDYIFTDTETYALHPDLFIPRKQKTWIFIDKQSLTTQTSGPFFLHMQAPIESIIEQLETINSQNVSSSNDNGKELSSREIEVLQFIVKGAINKEIADKLSISLNTVLTHRKNITSKLGIKTVSGLTFYAMMNGYISSDSIE